MCTSEYKPVEWDDCLGASEVDEAAGDAGILEDVRQQRGNQLVEELLRGRNTQLRVENDARISKLLSDCVVPTVEGAVGERVGREVRNEEDLPLPVLPEAVHDFERFHPFDDGVLMTLLGDVHLARHAVVE